MFCEQKRRADTLVTSQLVRHAPEVAKHLKEGVNTARPGNELSLTAGLCSKFGHQPTIERYSHSHFRRVATQSSHSLAVSNLLPHFISH